MTVLTKRAVEVFAPVTAAGAQRGAIMEESSTWGTEIERSVEGAAAGRVDQATWAGLAAIAGTRPGQPAIVFGPDAGTHVDPVTGATVQNVGEYYWSASPAGWRRAGNLQRTLVHALNSGTGTPNAIQATSDVQFSQSAYAALITVNFIAANTGAMTLSINGEAPRALVTNTGDPIPANYVQAKMSALVQIDADGKYRLFSYGDASAIQAAAEAAQLAAEQARDDAQAAAAAANGAVPVIDRAAMLALNTATKRVAVIYDEGERNGTFRWKSSDVSNALLGPAITSTAVNSGTGVITKAAHGLYTCQSVVVTTAVNGLAPNTVYRVIRVDANNFKLASSFANAVAGTAVTLTGTTNFSVKRHFDPQQGKYVTPSTDISGASGAWKRLGFLKAGHFGATGDGVVDDTVFVFDAINSGFTSIDGDGLNYKITAPVLQAPKTEFKNFTLTNANTSNLKMLLVTSYSKVRGKFVGSGQTAVLERGIYPADNAVANVDLDVVVTNLTVGVQMEPGFGGIATADAPIRWTGRIHCEDIVGTVGSSVGYGVLGTGRSCNLVVTGKNIRRHLLYLTQGASNNFFDVDCDGCGNYAVQINTSAGSPASENNTLRIKTRNLTEDVAGQSGPIAILTESHNNTVILDCSGNGNDNYAAFIQGPSGGPYPTGNKIINGSVRGNFKGSSVIRTENADGTIINDNVINAYAVNEVIGLRIAGTHGVWHGGSVEGNTINAQGQNIAGIYDEVTSAPSYIGPNVILNNGTGKRVDDQTGGKRTGWSRSAAFSGTSPSIAAAAWADVIVPINQPIAISGSTTLVNLTGALTENAWAGFLSRASETGTTIRCFNGGAGAKAISFAGMVYGD